MNFYDLIAKFKYKCLDKISLNKMDEHELNKAIAQAQQQINILNQTKPLSPYIIGCAGVVNIFAAMFISLFGTSIWLAYLALGLILTFGGYIQEQRVESHNKLKQEWYKYKTDMYQEYCKNQIEKNHLNKLYNDIERCCNYYMYLVEGTQKDIPITINLDEVFRSYCLLSSFLDKFYSGELESYLKQSPTNRVILEKTFDIDKKIADAKREKELHIVGEKQPRRRRATRFHNPEETTNYQDTIPQYLKRRA